MTCGPVGSCLVPELWSKPLWAKVWPFLDAWDSVRLRTASTQWSILGKYGPLGELFFFLIQKKSVSVPDSEAFNSFIGDGFRVTELKGGSEASDRDQADNVNNEALYVIGLHGFGDIISLCLQDWEMAKVRWHLAVTWPWTCCARKCTNWKGDVGGSGSERGCRLCDKPL